MGRKHKSVSRICVNPNHDELSPSARVIPSLLVRMMPWLLFPKVSLAGMKQAWERATNLLFAGLLILTCG